MSACVKKGEPVFLKASLSLTLIEIRETYMSSKTVNAFNCFNFAKLFLFSFFLSSEN